jgi:hypothetical protein
VPRAEIVDVAILIQQRAGVKRPIILERNVDHVPHSNSGDFGPKLNAPPTTGDSA